MTRMEKIADEINRLKRYFQADGAEYIYYENGRMYAQMTERGFKNRFRTYKEDKLNGRTRLYMDLQGVRFYTMLGEDEENN